MPLPISNFEWLSEEEIEQLNWLTMLDEQETGYILEVDLNYPANLHKDHNSFPLAPERLTITPDLLSDYAKGILSLSI